MNEFQNGFALRYFKNNFESRDFKFKHLAIASIASKIIR